MPGEKNQADVRQTDRQRSNESKTYRSKKGNKKVDKEKWVKQVTLSLKS